MLAWQITFVNWKSWTIYFMIYRTYVQDKPFRAVQALRRDIHLLQKYFTACRTCLCKGHELGSDRIKTEMQVKQMITHGRTFIKWRKKWPRYLVENDPKMFRAPSSTLAGFMMTNLAIWNISWNNCIKYYVIAAKLT